MTSHSHPILTHLPIILIVITSLPDRSSNDIRWALARGCTAPELPFGHPANPTLFLDLPGIEHFNMQRMDVSALAAGI
jgi:hypothetical protein